MPEESVIIPLKSKASSFSDSVVIPLKTTPLETAKVPISVTAPAVPQVKASSLPQVTTPKIPQVKPPPQTPRQVLEPFRPYGEALADAAKSLATPEMAALVAAGVIFPPSAIAAGLIFLPQMLEQGADVYSYEKQALNRAKTAKTPQDKKKAEDEAKYWRTTRFILATGVGAGTTGIVKAVTRPKAVRPGAADPEAARMAAEAEAAAEAARPPARDIQAEFDAAPKPTPTATGRTRYAQPPGEPGSPGYRPPDFGPKAEPKRARAEGPRPQPETGAPPRETTPPTEPIVARQIATGTPTPESVVIPLKKPLALPATQPITSEAAKAITRETPRMPVVPTPPSQSPSPTTPAPSPKMFLSEINRLNNNPVRAKKPELVRDSEFNSYSKQVRAAAERNYPSVLPDVDAAIALYDEGKSGDAMVKLELAVERMHAESKKLVEASFKKELLKTAKPKPKAEKPKSPREQILYDLVETEMQAWAEAASATQDQLKRGESAMTMESNAAGKEIEEAATAHAKSIHSLGAKEGSPLAKFKESPGELIAAIQKGSGKLNDRIRKAVQDASEQTHGFTSLTGNSVAASSGNKPLASCSASMETYSRIASPCVCSLAS